MTRDALTLAARATADDAKTRKREVAKMSAGRCTRAAGLAAGDRRVIDSTDANRKVFYVRLASAESIARRRAKRGRASVTVRVIRGFRVPLYPNLRGPCSACFRGPYSAA